MTFFSETFNNHNISYPVLPKASKVFSKIGFSLFGYVLLTNIIYSVVAYFTAVYLPDFYLSTYFDYACMLVIQYLICMPLLYLFLSRTPKYVYPKEKMSAGSIIVAFIMCTAICQIGNYLGMGVNALLEEALGYTIANPVNDLIMDSKLWICLIVVSVIGPIMEELIFRKWVIDRIRPYGEKISIIYSAIIFGLFHGNFHQLFYAAGLGLLLGFIYIRTKNVLYPIILHIAFNFCFGIIPQMLMPYYDLAVEGDLETLTDASNILGVAAVSIYSNLVLIFSIVGVILLITNRKKFFTVPNINQIPKGKGFKTAFLNAGTIVFIIFIALMFAAALMPQVNT